jgi:hypothetical protein
MPANRRGTKRPLAVTLQHRHFAFIAAVLAKERPDYCDLEAVDQWRSTVRAFTEHLAVTNPRFDRARFLTACGMEPPQYQTEAGERLLYPRPD